MTEPYDPEEVRRMIREAAYGGSTTQFDPERVLATAEAFHNALRALLKALEERDPNP